MDTYKVLTERELAAVSSPFRQKLLAALENPQSAAGLARHFDVSRQRIGYHMRDLEQAGCIELVRKQQARGLTERLYRARPCAFVSAAPEPDTRLSGEDRYSWRALVNLVASSLRDLVVLRRRADKQKKRLATLAMEAELHFRSAAERKAFAEDLVEAVEAVVRKHERPASAGTRSFQLVVGAYPGIKRGTGDGQEIDTKH